MEFKENRLKNTQQLIESVGGMAKFAEKIGKSRSQVSAFAGKNPIKGIGNKVATEIEKAFAKHPGWLDEEHARTTTFRSWPMLPNLDVDQLHKVVTGKATIEELASSAPKFNLVPIPEHGPQAFTTKVFNDANIPIIPQNSTVIIDPEVDVEIGDFGLFFNKDTEGLSIARLGMGLNGKQAECLNQDYPAMPLISSVTILGRVMEILAVKL